MNLVKLAQQAHAEKKYAQAIQIYRQLSALIGEKFFLANIELCKRRLNPALQLRDKRPRSLPSHDANGLIYADQIKVALIADEFTTNSFADEFQALPIEPDNWLKVFKDNKPDVFFCESAWSGPDSVKRPWKGRIYASKNFANENRTELLQILKYCNKHNIPTIFWNKEDPTHHSDRVHDFVKTAQEFDFVFTTAEECVDSYKTCYGVRNAYALPFATNPKLFNPVERKSRSSNVVFAGSWYANHKDRSADMSMILDRIMSYGHNLEIYDRYYNDSDPLHEWPDSYKPYLLPSRPHNEMPEVYKSGVFGLNFNTVTNSPTMFARRVFELMSSNTLVISNHSDGTKKMFGDLIIYPDREPHRLRDITATEIDEIRNQALVKVLEEHTYTQRWHTILEKIGLPFAKRIRNVSFVSKISSKLDAHESISWFQQHGYSTEGSALLLIAAKEMSELDVAIIYKEFNRFGVTVTSVSHANNYAIDNHYNPVQTTHFVEIRQSLDVNSITLALLHAQYMVDYPIVINGRTAQRYKIEPIKPEDTVIYPSFLFAQWLNSDNHAGHGYYI
ncbi:glycosyltransferase [Pseudomonas sp. URMO17WK12:I11]|uniref:CgeB family protein n=1 Tax=Pseudomonas sp. URMO17WK12:I11 TaxID=1283291 RepID=UPI0011A907F9|nr:glycosyltransferase [Pseudomonas sp. URMO17WK12:I11]